MFRNKLLVKRSLISMHVGIGCIIGRCHVGIQGTRVQTYKEPEQELHKVLFQRGLVRKQTFT